MNDRRNTILVIDDNKMNIGILINTLKLDGFKTVTARSGAMGIRRAEFSEPDLILLDVMMPGIDGFETCRRLRADDRTKDIPVIFMTALTDVKDKLRGFEVGAVDYVTKPFEEAEVLARVKMHLALRNTQKQLREEIVERERAEKKRREYQHRLQQARKAESLGRMAGAVAHHFNNLLYIVSGNLELVRDDLPPQSELTEFLHDAEKALGKAIKLSRLMLTYVGQGGRKMSVCDLAAEVSGIAPLAEGEMPDNVGLQLELASGLPSVRIALDDVRVIVMNLVENAWESMESGVGTVRAVTGKTSCGRSYLERAAWVENCAPGEYVFIEVADDGCGMDAETIDRMFDPFFTTKFTGRGLGLASVAGIVRSGRGAIAVSSEPGEGTRVRVLFPVADESE